MTETIQKSAAQQFADDYLLIMTNDQGEYERLMAWASLDTYEFAEYIKESFEDDATGIIGDTDSPIHWLMRQALLQWGIEPFILIAQHIQAIRGENSQQESEG
jgi:hypothetical protein